VSISTIPYADGGPTHASNFKCYCRAHRLRKLRDGEDSPFSGHALEFVIATVVELES
jgi:hypothetical protein